MCVRVCEFIEQVRVCWCTDVHCVYPCHLSVCILHAETRVLFVREYVLVYVHVCTLEKQKTNRYIVAKFQSIRYLICLPLILFWLNFKKSRFNLHQNQSWPYSGVCVLRPYLLGENLVKVYYMYKIYLLGDQICNCTFNSTFHW